jgi:hypothetical protein
LASFAGRRLELDPSRGVDDPQLQDRNLRPTLAHLAAVLAQTAELNADAYACHITELQRESVDFLVGRDFATLMRVASTVFSIPEVHDLDAFLVSLVDPADPVASSLLQTLGATLSTTVTHVTEAQTEAIAEYARAVAAGREGDAHELIATLDALLGSEGADAMLAIGRDLLSADPLTGRVRASVFTDAWDGVARIEAPLCVAQAGPDDLVRAEERVALMRDALDSRPEGSAIRLIYDLLE